MGKHKSNLDWGWKESRDIQMFAQTLELLDIEVKLRHS